MEEQCKCASSKKVALKKKKNTQAAESSKSNEFDSSRDSPPHKQCQQLEQDEVEEIDIENEASDDEPEVVELENGDAENGGEEDNVQIIDPKVSGYIVV